MKLRGKKNKNKNKKKIKEKKEEKKEIDFVVEDDRDGGWETITGKKEVDQKKKDEHQEKKDKLKWTQEELWSQMMISNQCHELSKGIKGRK